MCPRLRTDFAVLYACGLREYQGNPAPAHFGLPETLCAFRSRIDEALRDDLLAMQAAAALAAGLVSPAPRVMDTLPSAQGSQRVTDATPLDKAQKKRLRSSPTARSRAPAGPSYATTTPKT
jgi:hypothetical protein